MPTENDTALPLPQDMEADAEQWDALDDAEQLNEDELDGDSQIEGELPEEDDDNPYGESDEALPDDDEEAAITADLRELDE